MSLHALAGHMASKGRGSDSMLVHMTPEEVQSLQVLALKGGGTLTINPDTGLPEANFLKKMLPMIAGLALAPLTAGTSLAFLGATPLASAMTVGGITGLATGSLSRGLMAGLGAYGGASLGAGLANAGTSALASSGAPIAENVAGAAIPPIEQINPSNFGFSAADKLSAGATSAFNDPKSFVTAMGGPAKAIGATAAAASPLMAADTVETTTPRQDTGYIRQKKFNPYTQQYIDLEPVKASEWGSRNFSDYADGGIVALAAGGAPATMDQNAVNQLVKEAAAQAGGTLSYADAANAAKNLGISNDLFQGALSTGLITGASQGYFAANPDVATAFKDNNYGLTADQFAQVHFNKHGQYEDRATPVSTSAPAPGSDAYNSMVGNWFSQYPNATAADVQNAITTYGLNPQDVTNAMRASGLSNAAIYAAFQPNVGVTNAPQGGLAGLNSNVLNFLKQYPNATQAEIDNAKNLYGYSTTDVVRPYEHGYQLASGQDAAAQKYLQDNPDVRAWLNTSEGKKYLVDHPEFDAADIAYTHYTRYGAAEGRKWGLPVIKPITPVDTAVNLPGGVSGGGNTVVNPNGTITTAPNIPGRPPGGFTGIGQVKDAYTQGGGSLGQSNLFVPKTLDEMYARYGNTGGSEQAYDYLMGKGAADIKKPVTKSGELMLPYSQAVLGQEIAAASGPATQKFLFDRRTRRYILNPAYTAAQEAAKKETPKPTEDSTVGGANGGVMRMALGGLGALAGGGSASQYNLGGYSDGGRLLRGPGDGVSDSIPATIGDKQPARLADGEFVVPARIVSELGNGSTEAGARKLYAMMDRVQKARGKTTGKNRVAANTRSEQHLPA